MLTSALSLFGREVSPELQSALPGISPGSTSASLTVKVSPRGLEGVTRAPS